MTLFPRSDFTGVCDVLINVYNYNKYTGLNRFENKHNCLLVMVEGDELYGEAPVAAQHEAGVHLLRAWGDVSMKSKFLLKFHITINLLSCLFYECTNKWLRGHHMSTFMTMEL